MKKIKLLKRSISIFLALQLSLSGLLVQVAATDFSGENQNVQSIDEDQNDSFDDSISDNDSETIETDEQYGYIDVLDTTEIDSLQIAGDYHTVVIDYPTNAFSKITARTNSGSVVKETTTDDESGLTYLHCKVKEGDYIRVSATAKNDLIDKLHIKNGWTFPSVLLHYVSGDVADSTIKFDDPKNPAFKLIINEDLNISFQEKSTYKSVAFYNSWQRGSHNVTKNSEGIYYVEHGAYKFGVTYGGSSKCVTPIKVTYHCTYTDSPERVIFEDGEIKNSNYLDYYPVTGLFELTLGYYDGYSYYYDYKNPYDYIIKYTYYDKNKKKEVTEVFHFRKMPLPSKVSVDDIANAETTQKTGTTATYTLSSVPKKIDWTGVSVKVLGYYTNLDKPKELTDVAEMNGNKLKVTMPVDSNLDYLKVVFLHEEVDGEFGSSFIIKPNAKVFKDIKPTVSVKYTDKENIVLKLDCSSKIKKYNDTYYYIKLVADESYTGSAMYSNYETYIPVTDSEFHVRLSKTKGNFEKTSYKAYVTLVQKNLVSDAIIAESAASTISNINLKDMGYTSKISLSKSTIKVPLYETRYVDVKFDKYSTEQKLYVSLDGDDINNKLRVEFENNPYNDTCDARMKIEAQEPGTYNVVICANVSLPDTYRPTAKIKVVVTPSGYSKEMKLSKPSVYYKYGTDYSVQADVYDQHTNKKINDIVYYYLDDDASRLGIKINKKGKITIPKDFVFPYGKDSIDVRVSANYHSEDGYYVSPVSETLVIKAIKTKIDGLSYFNSKEDNWIELRNDKTNVSLEDMVRLMKEDRSILAIDSDHALIDDCEVISTGALTIKNGKITSVKAGTAYIQAKMKDGSGVTYNKTLKIQKPSDERIAQIILKDCAYLDKMGNNRSEIIFNENSTANIDYLGDYYNMYLKLVDTAQGNENKSLYTFKIRSGASHKGKVIDTERDILLASPNASRVIFDVILGNQVVKTYTVNVKGLKSSAPKFTVKVKNDLYPAYCVKKDAGINFPEQTLVLKIDQYNAKSLGKYAVAVPNGSVYEKATDEQKAVYDALSNQPIKISSDGTVKIPFDKPRSQGYGFKPYATGTYKFDIVTGDLNYIESDSLNSLNQKSAVASFAMKVKKVSNSLKMTKNEYELGSKSSSIKISVSSQNVVGWSITECKNAIEKGKPTDLATYFRLDNKDRTKLVLKDEYIDQRAALKGKILTGYITIAGNSKDGTFIKAKSYKIKIKMK